MKYIQYDEIGNPADVRKVMEAPQRGQLRMADPGK